MILMAGAIDGPESQLFPLRVDSGSAVATITLNRPERVNALTFDIYGELRNTFHTLDSDAGVRAIIITGTG